jgi:DoxX-like family
LPSERSQRVIGWTLSALVALFMIGVSASGKFTEWEGKEAMFASFGFTAALMKKIGVVEVVVALLSVIPRTALIGVILLTGYLGGAMVTHIRIGQPFWMPLVLGIVAWVGLGLRRPELGALLRAK